MESQAKASRRLDVVGRLQCYVSAVLCATVFWWGVLSPAESWQKWAALFAGVAGLVALCGYIVHRRWQ